VPQRIEFKLAELVFRCQHFTREIAYVMWQTWTLDGDSVLLQRSSWTFHQRVASQSVTTPSQPLQLACGTVCRRTSSHRHSSPSSNSSSRHYPSAIHLMSDYHLHDTVDFIFCFVLWSALEVILTQ